MTLTYDVYEVLNTGDAHVDSFDSREDAQDFADYCIGETEETGGDFYVTANLASAKRSSLAVFI